MNNDSGMRWKWIERFARALDSVRFSDRSHFLDDLVDATLQVSRAARAYGILMERDAVLAEAALTSGGNPWPADDLVRKMAARAKLRAAERLRAADEAVRHPGIETEGDRAILSFVIRDDTGGAIILEKIEDTAEAERDLGLTAGLVLASARALEARELMSRAIERASHAETRQQEIERSMTSGGVGAVAYLKPMAELERDAIELALRSCAWNKEKAARRVGISRASIYMKVKKYGLQRPPGG